MEKWDERLARQYPFWVMFAGCFVVPFIIGFVTWLGLTGGLSG